MRLDEITESFDTDVKGKLVRATNDLFTTSAEIGGRKIVFNASSYEAGMDTNPVTIWEIEFTERSPTSGTTYGKSGNGSEMAVFSFVIESIKELVSRYSPEEITFTSHKEDGNRSSLYSRIARRIKIPGYKLAPVDSVGPSDHFRIVRDK